MGTGPYGARQVPLHLMPQHSWHPLQSCYAGTRSSSRIPARHRAGRLMYKKCISLLKAGHLATLMKSALVSGSALSTLFYFCRIFRARLHCVVARNNLPCSPSQNDIDRSKIFPAHIPAILPAGGREEKLCLASQVKDLAGQQKPTVKCWFMSFRPGLFIWKRVAQGPWQLLPSFLPSQPTVQH